MFKKIENHNKYINKSHKKMVELVNNNLLPEAEKYKQMRKTIFSTIIFYKLMVQETIDLINKYSDYKRVIETRCRGKEGRIRQYILL